MHLLSPKNHPTAHQLINLLGHSIPLPGIELTWLVVHPHVAGLINIKTKILENTNAVLVTCN